MVVQTDFPESLSKFAELVCCLLQRRLITVDTSAVFHRFVHFRPDRGDALAASGLAQKLLFQAELFVQGLRDDAFARRLLFHGCQGCGFAGAGAKD